MPQAGWYPDPSGNAQQLRYWDGTAWTQQVMSAQSSQPAQQPFQQQNGGVSAYYPGQHPNIETPPYAVDQTQSKSSLLRVAYIFYLICMILVILVCIKTAAGTLLTAGNLYDIATFVGNLIPMAWVIPMTVHCERISKGTKPNTVAFGVCSLLFASPVSGILLLCAPKTKG